MSSGEFAVHVEPWIVDFLGFTEDDWMKDRRELSQYDYGETSNRQGTFPRVETLRTYLEYHGMLLAAGRLVDDGTPALIPTYEDEYEPWMYWLARHLDSSPDWWLADLRDPTPLDPELWGRLRAREEWQTINEEDFDASLGLPEHGEEATELVVAGFTNLHDQGVYGTVYVTSALVTPATATSLLAALETAPAYSFGLPQEDDSDYDSWAIELGDHRLVGWLRDVKNERDSLDERDPLARINYSFAIPGDTFVADEALTADRARKIYRTRDGTTVVRVESWSDELPGQRDVWYGYSDGWRTWVSLSHLLDHMRRIELELIVHVHIDRHLTGRAEGERVHDPGQSRIYLIRGDGSIETLFRRRQLGSADRR